MLDLAIYFLVLIAVLHWATSNDEKRRMHRISMNHTKLARQLHRAWADSLVSTRQRPGFEDRVRMAALLHDVWAERAEKSPKSYWRSIDLEHQSMRGPR